MPKMIQLRRVPDEVYTVVKAKAEAQGLSMSDFLVQELTAQFGSSSLGPASEQGSAAQDPKAAETGAE